MKSMRMKLIASFGVLLCSIGFLHSEALGQQCDEVCPFPLQPPGDCDDNGVCDPVDINNNNVPDCNSNCVPDSCDIDSGTSQDCNRDGVPDDCQLVGNDCDGNGVPDECETTCCPWDIVPNGIVEEADLTELLEQWGTVPGCTAGCAAGANACVGDFDRNCVINVTDLLDLLAHWGDCACSQVTDWCP